MSTSDPNSSDVFRTTNILNVVYISLGSNIQAEHYLTAAVQLLAQSGTLKAMSSVYRTPPQGDEAQPDFYNMALKLVTPYRIGEYKSKILEQIETDLGRVRDPGNKNAARTIDLDIALWNKDIVDYGSRPWHVPNEDITRFAHVALPLAEIAPHYQHPEAKQTLAEIAASLDQSGIIRLSAWDFSAVGRPLESDDK
jgi:2-amino-4-hydroxy-6-hydroxymethyldihydropteridine diphosphokinase